MKNWQIHTGSKVENLEVIDIEEESKLVGILDEFTEWDDPSVRLIKPDNARLDLTVSKPYGLVQYMQPSLEPPSLVADSIIAALNNGNFHAFPDSMARQIQDVYQNYATNVVEANLMEG